MACASAASVNSAHVPLDGGQQQSFGRVEGGSLQVGRKGRAGFGRVAALDDRFPVVFDDRHMDFEHFFLLAAVKRQHLMRAHMVGARFEGVIQAVNRFFVAGIGNFFGMDSAEGQRLLAHALAHRGVVSDGFRDDVARTGQRILDRGDVLGQVGGGQGFRRFTAGRLLEDQVGQRLQAVLAGNTGAGTAFGFVGGVQVFQFGEGGGSGDLFAQFVG